MSQVQRGMSGLNRRELSTALHQGDLSLFQTFVRENVRSANPQLSNEQLLQKAMQSADVGRVICLLQANCEIDHIIYNHDLGASPPTFVAAVCHALLASGYPMPRMRGILATNHHAALQQLRLQLDRPLPLKAQCRIYMKRYFSPRGRLCAHATKVQRGLNKRWTVNIYDVIDQLPLPQPLKDYLLLKDMLGEDPQ